MIPEPPQIPGGILLVEDDSGDIALIREALKDVPVTAELNIVRNGAEAMDFLRGRPPHARAARPGLILLDLNLPRMNGLQVLAEIKSDAVLRGIPVVVLTTSDAETDIASAYDLQASCFVQKPMDVRKFIRAVRSINEFYGSVARLPPRPRP